MQGSPTGTPDGPASKTTWLGDSYPQKAMIPAHKIKVRHKYWYLGEKRCSTSNLLQSDWIDPYHQHCTCVPGDKWWWDSSVTCKKSCLSTKFCKFKDVIFEWKARSSTFSVNRGSKAHNIGLQQTGVTSGWQGWRCNLSRKLEYPWSTSSLVQTQPCFAYSLCQSPPTFERRNYWIHAE